MRTRIPSTGPRRADMAFRPAWVSQADGKPAVLKTTPLKAGDVEVVMVEVNGRTAGTVRPQRTAFEEMIRSREAHTPPRAGRST